MELIKRCLPFIALILLMFSVQPSTAKRRLNKEERKKLKAAQEENASLQEQVTKLAECTSRVSELEYHNNALEMINKQQIPQIEEKATKAINRLKAAGLTEAYWRLYLTVVVLAFGISASYKGYHYVQLRMDQQKEQLRKEKAALKAEKRKRR